MNQTAQTNPWAFNSLTETAADYTKRTQALIAQRNPAEAARFTSGAITSANLTPTTTPNYTPAPTYSSPTYNATGVVPPGTPQGTATAQETKISGATGALQDLNKQSLGQSQYTTDQQNAQGIPTLTATQNDLAAKSRALQAKSQALSLAAQYTLPNQAQLDALGRGVTTAGRAPILASDLRKNQIEQGSVAFEQLTNDSALAATQGQISTAKYLVEQAVNQKFGPIKEQIQVAKDNLQLLIDDPATSLQDKNRALAVQAIKDAQDQAITQQKTDMTNILTVANNAASFGADSTTLEKIRQANTPIEALEIAAQSGFTGPKTGEWGTPYMLGGNYVQRNSLTGEIRTASNPDKTASGAITGEQLKQQINKEIATPEFQALSDAEKAQYIQSQGGTPYDFGY